MKYPTMENQKNIQSDIKKLLKKNNINQPNAIVTDQTTPHSEWKICVPSEIEPSIQRLTVTQIRSKLQEKNLSSAGNKLKIKKLTKIQLRWEF